MNGDTPRIVDCVKLLLRPRPEKRSLPHFALVGVNRTAESSLKEKLSGRQAVAFVSQVKVKEYRIFARFLLQLGNRALSLGDIRRCDVNGRITV